MDLWRLLIFIILIPIQGNRSVEELYIFDMPEVVITAKPIYNAETLIAAKCVCGESEGEPFLDKVYVANVIWNRSENRGKSILQIIKEPGQFDGMKSRRVPTADCFKAAWLALQKGFRPLPKNVEFFLNPKTSTDTKWVRKISKYYYTKVKRHHYYTVP